MDRIIITLTFPKTAQVYACSNIIMNSSLLLYGVSIWRVIHTVIVFTEYFLFISHCILFLTEDNKDVSISHRAAVRISEMVFVRTLQYAWHALSSV